MADLTERQVAQALFALDAMADEWAESTNLYAMVRANVLTDESASKLVTLMKQAWVEGAYAGRISQFTDPPQRPAQETSARPSLASLPPPSIHARGCKALFGTGMPCTCGAVKAEWSAPQPRPALEGPILPGERFIWEPDNARAWAIVEITKIACPRNDERRIYTKTLSGNGPAHETWNDESRFREACIRAPLNGNEPLEGGR